MRILLLGEYSGLHKNLKEGLEELGHEAILAATRDGKKQIPVDINLDRDLPGAIGALQSRWRLFSALSSFRNFNVVQLMNPFLFKYRFFPVERFYKAIKAKNEKFYLLAAGSDAYYWRYGRKALAYGPFEDTLKYDLNLDHHYYESESALNFNSSVAALTDGVIPIMYEYEVSYSGHKKLMDTIPIPINTNLVQYKPNFAKSKLVIFHGLTRYGFKGTRLVEEAFEILEKKYPQDLTLIIEGGLPLHEYLELMKTVNVVVDQVYSYSCGVNGVYALALGKIVIGGAEPKSLKSIGVDESPVINVKPSVDSIVSAVERVLANKRNLEEHGYRSRIFAEEVHGHIKVAEKYVNAWTGQ